MLRKTLIAIAATVAALAPASANAAYLVQVLGLFGPATPVTAESAPNLQFTMAFNLPEPFAFSTPAPGYHLTSDAYNFSYTLNGQPAGSGLQYAAFGGPGTGNIQFFFLDQTTLFLSGPSVETNGVLATPSYNFFMSYLSPNGQPFSAAGLATVSITRVESPVPEPATWAMMIGGFGLIGGALRRRRAATPALALAAV
jgi:hypothetical protein